MNLDFFSDQIDIFADSEQTSNDDPNAIECTNQNIASLLPPLPVQNKIKQNQPKHENNNVRMIQISPRQLQNDNSKRISDLIHYPVPNFTNPKEIESTEKVPYKNCEDDTNEKVHEPVINNRYKKSSFSKLNPDKANVHLSIDRASSGLSSDAQSLNTTEPIALYLNAECDESSPKSDIDQHKFTTELVIDNGFVVHDSEIQTNTKKEGNSNQNQTNKPSQKVIQSSKEKVKNRNKPQQKKDDDKDSIKEEAKNAMNRFLNNNEIPPENLQPIIVGLIRSEVINATMNEEYNKAAELENASSILSTAIEWRTSESRRIEEKKTINGRYNQIKRTYESETGEWKKIFSVFKDQQKENQKKLEQAHDEEMRAFEEKWSTSSSMMKYTKPSPKLIQLRKLQKNLAISHQFEEAKRVKLSADAQQLKESEEAKKRAEQTMINEYDALLEKQKREKQCFYDHQKTTELFLKNQQCRVLQPLEMQMKQLKTAINKDKPTNLKPRKFTFQSTAKTKIAAAELNPTSPRIVNKFVRYKKNEEAPKLSINGLDVRKIICKKRGSSVQPKRLFI